jgi:hypothetical protein
VNWDEPDYYEYDRFVSDPDDAHYDEVAEMATAPDLCDSCPGCADPHVLHDGECDFHADDTDEEFGESDWIVWDGAASYRRVA